MKVYLFSMLLMVACYSCEHQKKHSKLDPMNDVIKADDKIKVGHDFPFDTLIKNKELALAIAEPILFNVFGKKDIESKLPYHCELSNGNWSIWVSPTQKDNVIVFGGTNGIIMRAINGEIISLIRTK